MSNTPAFDDDLHDEFWTPDSPGELSVAENEMRGQPKNKDARRRLDDLLEQRRLKQVIHDDFDLD
ncbi:MAG: hypothetical protein PHI49_00155 [Halothiobacillaceae bacterium]|jgi:hypothetical protein|nr:hypothetical protein [Halothiobacillaceae bacterium]MDY0050577.1 hypothetical protein [Halothiobacillaceae bacterium]